MRILLTNDDGIFAPGLAAIYKQLIHLGEVLVVAPADSQSGASHAVTFFEPLACAKADIDGLFSGFAVYGSPADCVKLGVIQLHKDPIDLVVAGINNGANVGINVYYSGTVAAAMEGAFLSIPAVALSLAAEAEMDSCRAASPRAFAWSHRPPADSTSTTSLRATTNPERFSSWPEEDTARSRCPSIRALWPKASSRSPRCAPT
jgi:5'/3'-nucleotidase SurE